MPFQINKKDINKYSRINEENNIYYRLKSFVVHMGSSMGGHYINYSCKLNKKSNKPIKILIADRTFSSIDKVPQGLLK